MEERYCILNADEAIKMIQEIKKQDENSEFVFYTVDFDNDTESKNKANKDKICIMVKKSNTIIYNGDNYIPHMQLFSHTQSIGNIVRKGIMHDLYLRN